MLSILFLAFTELESNIWALITTQRKCGFDINLFQSHVSHFKKIMIQQSNNVSSINEALKSKVNRCDMQMEQGSASFCSSASWMRVNSKISNQKHWQKSKISPSGVYTTRPAVMATRMEIGPTQDISQDAELIQIQYMTLCCKSRDIRRSGI